MGKGEVEGGFIVWVTLAHSWSLAWVIYGEAAAPLVRLEASEGGSGLEGYQVCSSTSACPKLVFNT